MKTSITSILVMLITGCGSAPVIQTRTCPHLSEGLSQPGVVQFEPISKGDSGEVVRLIETLTNANRENHSKHRAVVKQYELCKEHLDKK